MITENDGIVENLGTVHLVGGESLVSQPAVFSRDSRYLFCCCGRRIRVYSAVTSDLLRELKGHDGIVTDAKISTRNHLQLITTSTDCSVILWDFTDGVILKKIICSEEEHKTLFLETSFKMEWVLYTGVHYTQRLHFGNPLFGILLHPVHENKIFLIKGERKATGITRYKLIVFDTSDDSKDKKSWKSLLPMSRETKQYAFSPKGDYIACVRENELLLWSFKKQKYKTFRYKTSVFTCLAFHPSELLVATGDSSGKIVIWQGLESSSSEPVTMELHWHAHQLSGLMFTSDGSYLLSGGEEAVLVLWQHQTHHRQFLPRLGGAIAHVTASPDDSLIAVSHKDNVIRLVSGVELKVKHTIQGLQQTAEVSMAMTCDPRSKTLVMSSMPGILQFYQPQSNHHVFSLDVVKQNFISNTDDQKLVFTQLTHTAFSDNGDWLATVENRDDNCTSQETRLKFWGFDHQSQRYTMNTCVDPPHDGRVVAVRFQPTTGIEHRTPLAVTVGVDGKFKIWTLGEEMVIKGKRFAWHCQSVGYYGNMKCQEASFSEDGSLLAVAYEQVVTLWDPITNALHRTLHSPHPEERIRKVVFGNNESSQYLMVTTSNYITVWNLLTCSVWWSVEAKVSTLLADPCGHCAAAFVRFQKKTHLYVFDPASPKPVAVQANIEKKFPVSSAVFLPYGHQTATTEKEKPLKSQLYFLNVKQELYTVDDKTEDREHDQPPSELVRDSGKEQSEFVKVFGHTTRTAESTSVERTDKTVRGTPSSAVVREMMNTPSHVLPPVTSLCSAFLKSLLISKLPARDAMEEDEDDTSDKGDSAAEDDSDSEMEESVPPSTDDLQAAPMDDSTNAEVPDYRRYNQKPGDFSFLQDFFV